jgi:DNA-binding response OmpR family regulator
MGIKLVVIEDNQALVESIVLIFRQLWPEAKLVYSYSGEPGIELVRSENPDAVILDLEMSDISGFEALRKIHLFYSGPIVVVSAQSTEEDVVKAMTQGAADYILKPFRPRQLFVRLQTQVDRWKGGKT